MHALQSAPSGRTVFKAVSHLQSLSVQSLIMVVPGCHCGLYLSVTSHDSCTPSRTLPSSRFGWKNSHCAKWKQGFWLPDILCSAGSLFVSLEQFPAHIPHCSSLSQFRTSKTFLFTSAHFELPSNPFTGTGWCRLLDCFHSVKAKQNKTFFLSGHYATVAQSVFVCDWVVRR